MENRNRLRDFPTCPWSFIIIAFLRGCKLYPTLVFLCQRRSSDMMKLQDLIATARTLFGGHRSSFSFVVLPFVGVVLFPSPTRCGSCVVP